MTRKRSPPSTKLDLLLRFGFKIVISVCVLFSLLAYFRLHFLFNHQSKFSASFRYNLFQGTPKIAFLFLVRRNLPLDFLWGTFFKNGDPARFSIYIHTKPGFVFNETTTTSAFFYGRQLNNSVQVEWGEYSMIEAEKLLIKAALQDPASQRFVLLSDSCVPLHNFSYTYSYLMFSPKSFVDSFIDVHRYSAEMSPTIPKGKWRKGSQWITLIRRHAEIVAHDTVLFPIFKKFCKPWPPLDLIRVWQFRQRFNLPKQDLEKILKQHHNCIPDEHYVQTLLTINGLEDELVRRTLTYTSWSQSATRGNTTSWHPITFSYADADPQKIRRIKAVDHIYQSENRTVPCSVSLSDRLTGCFLFARKFTRGAAMRLLTEGTVGLYDPSALSNASA